MGIVEFSSSLEASRAIKELLDTDVEGRPLWVSEDSEDSRPKTSLSRAFRDVL